MSENNLDTFSVIFEAVTGQTMDDRIQEMTAPGGVFAETVMLPPLPVTAARVEEELVHNEVMQWFPVDEAEAAMLPMPFAAPVPEPALSLEDMTIPQLHELGVVSANLVEDFEYAVEHGDFATIDMIMGVVRMSILAYQQGTAPIPESDQLVARELSPSEIRQKWLDDKRVELQAAIANALPIAVDFGSARFTSVVHCLMAAAKNDEQLESFISFMNDGKEEAANYLKLLANTMQGLNREAVEEMQQCDSKYRDFFQVVHAKLDGIVEFSPENIKLLAGVDSPILKCEMPAGTTITSTQAYCMSDIFAMYAAYVLTCSSDEYANGKYHEYDETYRTELEHINVHCLSVLGVNSFVHRSVSVSDYEIRFSPLYAKIEDVHSKYVNRTLFVMLMGMYRGTLAGDIFNWALETVDVRKHIIEEDGLPSIGVVEEGMRRLTAAKGTWQSMVHIVAPYSVYPMINESIDMASYLMLENYKKTKLFSFSLLTMQGTMFSYLLRNDSDMSILGSLQALQAHIDGFIGSEIKLPKEEVTDTGITGETTILSSNTSKLLSALYGHKLPEFKAANPHVMFT